MRTLACLAIPACLATTIGCSQPTNTQPIQSDSVTNSKPEVDDDEVDGDIVDTVTTANAEDSNAQGKIVAESNARSESNELRSPEDELYVVSEYDVDNDPAADLEKAVKRATLENKRIIIQVGGDWCSWCTALHKHLDKNPLVYNALAASFVVIKVSYTSEHPNEAFLTMFPEADSYPHWILLSPSGQYLHSQDMEELESGKGYSSDLLIKFAEKWKL